MRLRRIDLLWSEHPRAKSPPAKKSKKGYGDENTSATVRIGVYLCSKYRKQTLNQTGMSIIPKLEPRFKVCCIRSAFEMWWLENTWPTPSISHKKFIKCLSMLLIFVLRL